MPAAAILSLWTKWNLFTVGLWGCSGIGRNSCRKLAFFSEGGMREQWYWTKWTKMNKMNKNTIRGCSWRFKVNPCLDSWFQEILTWVVREWVHTTPESSLRSLYVRWNSCVVCGRLNPVNQLNTILFSFSRGIVYMVFSVQKHSRWKWESQN